MASSNPEWIKLSCPTAKYCTMLPCTTPHYSLLYPTALNCTTLHWHSNILHCTVMYHTFLLSTPLYCIVPQCTVRYPNALYNTKLHCTAPLCTVLYPTALYYATNCVTMPGISKPSKTAGSCQVCGRLKLTRGNIQWGKSCRKGTELVS